MYMSDINDGQLGKLKIGKALKKVGKVVKKVASTVAPFVPAAAGVAITAGILKSKSSKKKAKKAAKAQAAADAASAAMAPQVTAQTVATASNMLPANVSEPAPVINNSPVSAASTARSKKKKSKSPKLTDSTDSVASLLQAAQGLAPQQQSMQPSSPGYSEGPSAQPNYVDNQQQSADGAEKPGMPTGVIIAGVAGLGLIALAMSSKKGRH